jgi:hypothetical protein
VRCFLLGQTTGNVSALAIQRAHYVRAATTPRAARVVPLRMGIAGKKNGYGPDSLDHLVREINAALRDSGESAVAAAPADEGQQRQQAASLAKRRLKARGELLACEAVILRTA